MNSMKQRPDYWWLHPFLFSVFGDYPPILTQNFKCYLSSKYLVLWFTHPGWHRQKCYRISVRFVRKKNSKCSSCSGKSENNWKSWLNVANQKVYQPLYWKKNV